MSRPSTRTAGAPWPLAALAFLCAFATGRADIETPAIRPFNGRDLAGWVAFPAAAADGSPIWTVRDGMIRCAGAPKGYLRTSAVYSNYLLQVDWRWVGKPGNSGVFVHGSGPDKVWPHCYEAQLAAGNAGEIRSNGGSKFHADSKPTERSLPKRYATNERPAGEWNRCLIRCHGGDVTVIVNGVVQNELHQADSIAGWIALQSEGGVVEFRGLVLAPLD
jgi:hypothetical protein